MINEFEICVDLKRKDLMKNTYWTLCKFMNDDYTIENASSKRSLLGDFIDRWTNKAPETLIFNKILENYDYHVVKDTFIYKNSKAKTAPDILGLIDKNGVCFPFAKFNNDHWEVEDNPIIEMKTFRSSQKLVTIPFSQFKDESFFAIVESFIPKDYLLSIFDKEFFSEHNLDLMKNYDEFIISDQEKMLSIPSKLQSNFEYKYDGEDVVGKYKLIGIFKGKDLKNYGRIVKKGDKPLYFSEIGEPAKRKNRLYDQNPPVPLNQGKYYFNDDKNNLPCFIKIQDKSEISIIRKTSKSIDVQIEGIVEIDDEKLKTGKYKLIFKEFSKDGKYEEYITTKSLLRLNVDKISALDELLMIFDKIVNENKI